jgi:mannitol-1-phosphate/altronate dehydrogenase
MKYAEQVVNEVKLGLANMIPNQAKELDRMAESFLHSCRAAYKDPCERVARDPLRKLNLNERVLGSLESHVQQQLPYQKLMQGAIYGYAYALKMLGLDEIKIVKHVQTNIEHMDITENQKKALLNQLYQGIQAELNDECIHVTVGGIETSNCINISDHGESNFYLGLCLNNTTLNRMLKLCYYKQTPS